MKTHVVKTTPNATLSEVVDLMDIYQVDSLPVVDDQSRLCGIIAEQDIAGVVLNHCAGTDREDIAGEEFSGAIAHKISRITVAEIMQGGVLAIGETEDANELARLILVNDYTRIPVTTSDEVVVGTLNRIDIIQSLLESQEGHGC